jgi:N-acetylneuraminic acid mutarotase
MSERLIHTTVRRRRIAVQLEGLEPRQVFAALTPFPQTTPTVPANTVMFANFDNGGEGVAFHDYDDRNLGGDYRRKNSGVDIERNDDADATNLGSAPGVGRSVGYTRAGEYLKYTLNVSTDGLYTFKFRFATSTGGTAHLAVDGQDVTGKIDLPHTGGWQEWKTISKTGVVMRGGTHVIQFVIDSSKFGGEVGNLHWFSFTKTGEAPDALPWPNSWTRIADAPFARYEATTHVFNGKAYLFGGYKDSDFHVSREYRVFNPATNTWTLLGSLPSGLSETHTGVADDGKYIYVIGGFSGDLKETKPQQIGSKRVFRLDPSTNKWSEIASLPQAQGAGGAAVIGRTLHFFGGNGADRETNLGNHYVLNLDNLGAGWKTAAPMPDPKDHFSTVVLNNKIYAIAGEYGHDAAFDTQKTMDVYDPASNSWKRLASMPIENSHAEGSTFAYKGQIIFAGGQTKDQQRSTDRVFAYDPAKDQWRELYHLPYYLQGSIVMVVGTKVYVTQGARFTEDALPLTFVGNVA